METNPYIPINSDDRGHCSSRFLDLGDFELHGTTIHCGGNLFLPMYCVVSGTDDDLEMIERDLLYFSPLARLIAICLLPITIAIPFNRLLLVWGLSSTCHVTYFVERSLIRQARMLLTLGAILIISALLWLAFVAPDIRTQGLHVLIGPTALFLLTVGFAVGFGRNPYPIRVVAFKDRKQLWIRGFSEPFIRRLEEM
ncbi:MAG: hypothetical protein JNL58_30215 [Planctomyces sp.]|nr:hypothetical protein [Planctomyces sp.]